MANIFTIILVIATLVTGLLWFLNKLIFFSKKHKVKIGVQTSTNNKNTKKTLPEISWLKIGASIFPMLMIVLIIRSFIYEPFQIPSGSMMPTLLIRDFILVDKFTYGIKDPIFQKTIIKTSHPKRGDIVVFKYPNNPRLTYIKRVVGLPGDKVSYDLITKEVTIQSGYGYKTSCKSIIPITYSNAELSDFVQTFYNLSDYKTLKDYFHISKSEINENRIRLVKRKETLDNVTHYILNIPIVQDNLEMYYQSTLLHQQSKQQLATWIVPPDQYFVMGDNRDNSDDSRYWGFVPEANIVGKAAIIWMSLEKQENAWLTRIRLNHIGRIS